MLNMMEKTRDTVEQMRRIMDTVSFDLRVAAPGIIQSVDTKRQTCTVQLAIRERLKREQGNVENVEIPILPDVPFFVYTGGGYCLTLPIKPGDDCLVIFGDNCMDAWWQSGGVQNQIERRRHDLSDGFAIVGFRSQPSVVSGYSADTAQLRNKGGDAYVEISGSSINIVGASVTIKADRVSTSSSDVTIAADSVAIDGSTTIDGKQFLSHKHSNVTPGDADTGGVS